MKLEVDLSTAQKPITRSIVNSWVKDEQVEQIEQEWQPRNPWGKAIAELGIFCRDP
jgi:hypothetical protein